MVCVCAGHDVKLRLSTHPSERGMAIKRLGWSSGLWFLLLLLGRPVMSSTATPTVSPSTPNVTAETEGPTANITTTKSNSSGTPLTTTVLNTTTAAIETSATSSNISTTIPARTQTTELQSTVNQTAETTPSTSTENTTSAETTTNSTTFTTTPDPSSSASTNETTAITQTSPPPVTPPTQCNFYQSCLNAFYWMTVEVMGTPQSKENLTTQLKELFRLKLDVCKVNETYPTSHSSSTATPVPYSTTSTSSVSGNLSLFVDMELIGYPANITKNAQCGVLLKLRAQADVCCVRNTVMSSGLSVRVLGPIQRVVVCADNITQISAGQYDQCNQSVQLDVCGAESQNISCSEGSTVIPLNGSCNVSQNTTATPPSLSNTTSTNSTATAAPGNGTASPANATTADADGLLSLSANASSLNASQVDQLISQLEALLSGPNVSLAVANTSVRIVNNLLDVPVAVISPFSKRVIGIVDAVGLKLVVSGTSQSVLSQSLALAVKKVDGANFQETSFSLIESSNLQIRSSPGPEAEGLVVRVVSSPLGSVVLPASLTQNLTAEQQQLVSRVQFNFFQKTTFFQDKSLGGRKLNSGILGSSVANLSISGLQKEVLITLRNTEPIPANHAAACVFWDFSSNGGSGGWSGSGCRVLNSSAEETQCACNHLTSFGILLDISKDSIPPEHLNILTYITYIGCGVSAIFLSATLLTYLAFGKLRKDIPSKILIQLCVALLLLNLVFLLDAWLALFPEAVGLCISTAFFLHYFLLASFTWMALEAVHMYLALVKVFNTYISRFMVKIGFAGWGIPLIVVIIVIAINKDNYGLVTYGRYADGTTDDFCWIRNDIAFYVAVVAYFCVVFLVNFSMFIVVMIQLCRIKKQNPHNVQNRSGWQELRSVAGLTVLLGLTWGFAFFAWGPVNLAFMYLFAIFNTLQGFFIFVFHCAMKENVRRQWRTYLCCGKLRLSENSEWSRTATQKINKTSKEKTSFPSSNSNNSSLSFLKHDSLASDVPMGIGNPLDDRTISAAEEAIPGSDVVLNEINDQYRGQRSY